MAPSDSERTPLLPATHDEHEPNESSPFLAQGQQPDVDNGDSQSQHSNVSSSTPSETTSKRRWPSLIAIFVLAVFVVVILILGFIVPPAVQKYAEDAVVLEPTELTVEDITDSGVRVRAKANLKVDGSRVHDANARRWGRFAFGIMRKLELGDTTVRIRLPELKGSEEFKDNLLGDASVSGIVVDVREGHTNLLDIETQIAPGDPKIIRHLVNEFLAGKLDRLRVSGHANLRLKSGIFPLGTHAVDESMVFEGQALYYSFASKYYGEKKIF